MTPYDTQMIGAVLKHMPDELLATVEPVQFQYHPAAVIVKSSIISDMINNERRRRKL